MDYIIIGGGIAGLYTAFNLYKYNPKAKVAILEAAPKLGGRIETCYKQGLSYEAGAGRFNNKHKLLHALLVELDLLKHKIAIHKTSEIVIPNISKIYSSYLDEFKSFDSIIQLINKEVKKQKLTSKELVSMNLIELAELVLPQYPMISKFMVDTYPYYSELRWLNSKSALDIFTNEFNEDIQYYILAGGLSQIIDVLSSSLKKSGCHIYTSTPCTDITCDDINNKYIIHSTRRGMLKEYNCDKVILACNKGALEQFKILKPIKSLLNSITIQPLYRIYARYPKNKDGTYWFSKIQKTVTNLKIKYIIPYDSKNGLIMISYTDGKYAKYWLNLRISDNDVFMSEINQELAKVYPDITIPAPLWIDHHYWANAAGYWKVGYDADLVIPKIIQPFEGKSLYICGENYSNHQAWIEGALETAQLVLRKLDGNSDIKKGSSSNISESKQYDGGGSSNKAYTLAEVAKHNKKSDAWIVINKNVYNITKWIPIHPGGDIIMKGVGKDATSMFNSVGHSSKARHILHNYIIGSIKL
jgi:protoporphyrinogen oxidase